MLFASVRSTSLLIFTMLACAGPPAPDSELCRDVIARLCSEPICPNASTRLNLPRENCQAALEMRTGCASAEFVFTNPSREQVLICRLPLVRESSQRAFHPSCDDVDETLSVCPDVVLFLGGTP